MGRPLDLIPSEVPLPYNEIPEWDGIELCEAQIDGYERTWREYVPTGYDGSKPVPLVLSIHGGARWRMHFVSCWAGVAERESFIVVFPQCLKNGEIRWNAWKEWSKEDGFPDDVKYLDELIKIIFSKYNIDKTRVYIHGHSVGDKMASTYAFERAETFAAGAFMGGSMGASCFVDESGEVFYGPQSPLPAIRVHGSEDLDIPLNFNKVDIKLPDVEKFAEKNRRDKFLAHQLINMHLWKTVNKTAQIPKLSVKGKFNVAVYEGDPCDFVYYCENGSPHSAPVELPDYIWTYFFSHYSRVDGNIIRRPPDAQYVHDSGCIALSSGSGKALADQQVVELSAAAFEQDGHIYIAALDIPKILPGYCASEYQDGRLVKLCGPVDVQAAAGLQTALFGGHYWQVPPCIFKEGKLFVAADAFFARMAGLADVSAWGVHYLTKDSFGMMSYDMAYLIRAVFGQEKLLSPAECLSYEKKLIEEWVERGGVVYDKYTLPKN